MAVNREYRLDQICSTWTQEEWNAMYQKAEKGNRDELIEDYNYLYNTVVSKNIDVVKEYNDMYEHRRPVDKPPKTAPSWY